MALKALRALLLCLCVLSGTAASRAPVGDLPETPHARGLAQLNQNVQDVATAGVLEHQHARIAGQEEVQRSEHAPGAQQHAQARQSDKAAAGQDQRQEQVQQLVQDVLQHGLPSKRAQQRDQSAQSKLRLHPMQRLDNVSSVEWEREHGTGVGSVPLIITDSQTDWVDPSNFTFEKFKAMVGHHNVRADAKQCRPGSANRESEDCHSIREAQPELLGWEWAALRPSNVTELGIDTYADFLDAQITEAETGHFMYAHDVGLSTMPEMAALARVPKYCANNYADLYSQGNATAETLLNDIHFPAIFFGAAGSSSPLHSDGRMTRFWITQLQGHKLVRAVPPSENARTDAADLQDFQPSIYPIDLMAPDFAAHPQLAGMLVYEALLAPGDVLYVPEGWGHQALNLEWTLMVTANYIDQHNVKQHLEWWRHEDYGTKEEQAQHKREYEAWFLPMLSPDVERRNLPMLEYFHWHNMENAPVSRAAKRYVAALEELALPPDEWRDSSSMPLLISAAEWNYVNLAKWLLGRGVDILHQDVGAAALRIAQDAGFTKMAALLRERLADAHSANEADEADMDTEHELSDSDAADRAAGASHSDAVVNVGRSHGDGAAVTDAEQAATDSDPDADALAEANSDPGTGAGAHADTNAESDAERQTKTRRHTADW